MTERLRVYHPETDEPFDVPVAKAQDLILNEGWRRQPLDPKAEPVVKTVAPERGIGTSFVDDATEEEDWRDSEVGREVVEYEPRARRRRKQ